MKCGTRINLLQTDSYLIHKILTLFLITILGTILNLRAQSCLNLLWRIVQLRRSILQALMLPVQIVNANLSGGTTHSHLRFIWSVQTFVGSTSFQLTTLGQRIFIHGSLVRLRPLINKWLFGRACPFSLQSIIDLYRTRVSLFLTLIML